jgi:hypothetical protein
VVTQARVALAPSHRDAGSGRDVHPVAILVPLRKVAQLMLVMTKKPAGLSAGVDVFNLLPARVMAGAA